jgi:hypothetical protein
MAADLPAAMVPVKLRPQKKEPDDGRHWRCNLKVTRLTRVKDCSVCVLTLAVVAGVPIMTSLGVLFFF